MHILFYLYIYIILYYDKKSSFYQGNAISALSLDKSSKLCYYIDVDDRGYPDLRKVLGLFRGLFVFLKKGQ
ncbi:hypothetical protein A2223_01790 [Candidatus Falkowbacteria bacterium RIFOXYA2_FULL_35_8]|nr:MAG: hypothetical protein A2300_00235 [Candidatus Falkowbacteria bacterium RIFOXYB2_FULL_35_7]OGF33993.1 MAG: hypothetical protein A2223_01790 [Candidatus Falkowbacteria bacterium RIFOXYA2_FULL_35_8]